MLFLPILKIQFFYLLLIQLFSSTLGDSQRELLSSELDLSGLLWLQSVLSCELVAY